MIKTGNQNINTGEYWDKRYEDRQGYEKETGNVRFNEAIRHINPDDRFLDIGCGIGTLCEMVKETYPNTNVAGIDISTQVIEENRKRNPTINFWADTVEHMPHIHDSTYDVVFSGETLEHINNPLRLFEQAHRALDEGIFIVTTPVENRINSPEHVWSFNKDDMINLAEAAGFVSHSFVELPEPDKNLVFFMVCKK